MRGLAAAHDIDIIHRDVKPENVFVTAQMAIKVLDFTAAKAAGRGVVQSTGKADGQGAARTILGTPPYMSPEQLRGERVDFPTDLYSLGVMAYEVLARRHPFADPDGRLPDELELARRQLSTEPKPLSAVAPGLPERLAALVTRLLAKDRDRRPARARDVAAELRAIRARYLQKQGSRAFEKEWRGAGSFATSGQTVVAGSPHVSPRFPSRRVVVPESGSSPAAPVERSRAAPAKDTEPRVIHITARRDATGLSAGRRRAVSWAVGGALVLLLVIVCGWIWASRPTSQLPPPAPGEAVR